MTDDPISKASSSSTFDVEINEVRKTIKEQSSQEGPYVYVPDPKYADEQRVWMELSYCIPDDNGVPPGCRGTTSPWIYCLLNHDNPFFNNSFTKLIGHIGYTYFDDKRKTYLGIASIITMIAMVMTTFGCFALSTDRSIVQRTYWAGGSLHNTTSGTYTTLYIGLRSIETIDCKFIPGYDSYSDSCVRHSIKWDEPSCKEGLQADACETCASVASSLELAAFFNCAFLVLSLLGAQTRMRRKADVPIQKMLGMGADLWGAMTLAYALFVFFDGCKEKLRKAYVADGMQNKFWLGNGFMCYEICVFAALCRACVHWLTPLPGMAKGFLTPICDVLNCKNWPWCVKCYSNKEEKTNLLHNTKK